jgi:hypothetical protein
MTRYESRKKGPISAVCVGLALLACACAPSDSTAPSSPPPTAAPTPEKPLIIAAAGDIACGPRTAGERTCRQMATSDLLTAAHPDRVLTLGDNQYGGGTITLFRSFFDPSWGRFKSIIHPTLGNHDYEDPRANGYFEYFNGQGGLKGPAGEPGRGYTSFDLGNWHFVALNSNCGQVDCAQQLRWLHADLAETTKPCTLAFWHHPLFTAAPMVGEPALRPFWSELYAARAELVLNGHSHNYQRFAPMTPEGVLDETRGIRQFVVGTGGRSLYPFQGTAPNLLAGTDSAFGVLKLTLYSAHYEWTFLPIAGSTFTDSGSGVCH